MNLKPEVSYELQGLKFHVYTEHPKHLDCLTVKQTHSDIVLDSTYILKNSDQLEGDGIILLNSDIPHYLAVKTADCIPIVVVGNKGVALLHAGWRGVAQRIYLSPEIVDLEPYYFFLGPSIQMKSFEVTEEFPSNFNNGENYYNGTTFDLQRYVTDDIKGTIPNAKVEDSKVDTFTHERLHSYRKDKTQKRNWNVLIPN